MGHYGVSESQGPLVVGEITVPVTPPSNDEIAAIADRYGLGLGPEDVEKFRELIGGELTSYEVVEQLYQASRARSPEPPVRKWQRPTEAANELGAWYVTTDIKGADDGPLAGRRIAVKDTTVVARCSRPGRRSPARRSARNSASTAAATPRTPARSATPGTGRSPRAVLQAAAPR